MDAEKTVQLLSQSIRDLVEVARLQGQRLDGHDKELEIQRKHLEVQERRLEAQERQSAAFQRRFDQFLKRFDAFLRGRGRDGR